MVLTDTWVAIGRQEKRTIGMESLIYSDKAVICLHVLKRLYPTEHCFPLWLSFFCYMSIWMQAVSYIIYKKFFQIVYWNFFWLRISGNLSHIFAFWGKYLKSAYVNLQFIQYLWLVKNAPPYGSHHSFWNSIFTDIEKFEKKNYFFDTHFLQIQTRFYYLFTIQPKKYKFPCLCRLLLR